MIRPVRAQTILLFWIMMVVLAHLSLPSWVGADETFEHNDPAFTFNYPSSFKPDNKFSPNELFRVKDPSKGVFSMYVGDRKEGRELSGSGKRWAALMTSFGWTKDVKLISSDLMKLKDGTPANLFKADWKTSRGMAYCTMGVTVYKDGRWSQINFHSMPLQWEGWGGKLEAEAKKILLSTKFK